MKIKITIILIILILVTVVYAADRKWSVFPVNTTVDDADEMLLIDIGTGNSERITVLNLFDTIDTSLELLTILTNETGTGALVFAIAPTLVTPVLGVIASGVGTTLTALNGENIQDDTIDNDSIDWGDMTDLTTDGALDADVVDEAHIADNGIDSEHYNDGSIDLVHIAAAAYAVDLVTTAPVTGATDNVMVGADADVTIALDFTAAWNFGGAAGSEWVNDGNPTTDTAGELALDTTIVDHQPLWQYYDGGENMTIIAIDTAQLPALDNEIIKYDAGTDKFVLEADAGGGGGNDVYVEEGDAARVDSSGADLYIDFDDTDFGVGVVGNEGNITITDDGHAHTGASVSGIAWDDIADSDAATTTSMASNDNTYSNVADFTWTSGTTSKPDLVITNTNDDATAGSLTMRKAGSTPTPADNDILGTINFEGDDSGGNNTTYVRLIGESREVDDGDEVGEFHIKVMFDDGSPALDDMFCILGNITGPGTGKFIWNQDSQDMDFRMETDDEDHFFYIDGGANWMRIGDWDTNYTAIAVDGTITQAGTATITSAGAITGTSLVAGSTTGDGTIVIHDDDAGGDTTVTIQAVDGGATYTLTLPPDDGGNTEVLQTDGNGVLTWVANVSGATAYDDIEDPDASGSISFDAAEGATYTSADDEWVGVTISNTQADNAGDTELLTLAFTDDGDSNSHYLIMSDAGGTQQLEFIQSEGNIQITTAGDLRFVADGGDFNFSDDNIKTTGNILADGNLSVGNTGSSAGVLTILEDDDDGANFASFTVPALGANTVYTLPPDDGDNLEVLQTNGGGTLTWVANAGATTAWDDIADPDLAATIDFVTYTQTIDIGVTDDGGPKSGLILDVTGLGAGVSNVIALEITTATDWDANFIPIAMYNNSGSDNDEIFKIDHEGSIYFGLGAKIYNTSADYIFMTPTSGGDSFYFYTAGTDCDIIWTDGALNLRNNEDGVDAIVEIEGKDGGEKGILRVMSDGDDKYIELHHDDTDGHIITNSGDIHIEPAGGDTVFTGGADFGEADLELPQASPAVPNADGEVELDFTDGKMVIQHGSAHTELGASTDVVMGSLIQSWSGTIYEPDGVNDVITVKAINSIEFPHGVVITAIYLGVSSDDGYVLTVQNFDDFDTINGAQPTIDTVTYPADATGEIIDTSPTYATIAAGQIIMISIPSTDVDWIHFEIYYYEPAA